MKQLFCIVVLAVLSCFQSTWAQDADIMRKIDSIKLKIETINKEERAALKAEVEEINQRLERGEISEAKAQELKEEAAEKRVTYINVRTLELEKTLAALNKAASVTSKIEVVFDDWEERRKQRRYRRRTTSDLVLALGFNNVIQEEQSLNDSEYRLAGSRFFEIGWAWRTWVFKNSDFVRFRYGVSLHINNLKPTGNRFFVDNNGETVLQEFPEQLDKSKLRFTNLVFPVHFEFGPSRKIQRDDYVRYSIRRKFKIGIGGYAGFNIGTKQKLKYNLDGERIKEEMRGDFNTNNFVYGLSSYISWGTVGLYAKYDLSPIFNDNQPEQRNISLGVRFDMD
ncbi:hypothetical protein [Ascidiimonas aurantiaca]|uniref:hypothetical protein n=1 Tax=Ascidiimonas aurantiaca TaxID=1685432 RepID=UPI0030ED0F33